VLFTIGLSAPPARADALRVALYRAASEDADLESLAGAIDPVLHSELGNVPDLQVTARPALDLSSMQLAIDCVGETTDCLTLAAKEAQADGLVAPQLRRIGSELVLTILFHDSRRQEPFKAVTERYAGEGREQKLLDGIPGMVRELFGLPEPEAPVATPPAPVPSSAPLPAEPPATAERPLPVLPIVLGAVGVAFLVGGIGFGLASNGAEDDYAKLKIVDDGGASARRATDKYESSKDLATVANVGVIVGSVALVAGVVTLILHMQQPAPLRDSARSSARLRFGVGPGQLALSGSWE
jgi:hypothetical protein